jgi:surfeit locus 1 family protein
VNHAFDLQAGGCGSVDGWQYGVLSTKLRRLLWPGVMTVIMLAVLLGLGTWQVQRLYWKLGILAQIANAEAAPPVPLPAEPSPFAKVQVTGRLRGDLSATFGADVRDTPAGPVLGTQLIEPLEREGDEPLLVDRGWVPDKLPRPIAPTEGSVTLQGYVHPGDTPGWFSAPDNPATRQFYTLDPTVIGNALGLPRVAPFILIAMGPTPQAGYPIPAEHLPRPPNNHLSYAITWYGLAVALVVIFAVWSRKALSE